MTSWTIDLTHDTITSTVPGVRGDAYAFDVRVIDHEPGQGVVAHFRGTITHDHDVLRISGIGRDLVFESVEPGIARQFVATHGSLVADLLGACAYSEEEPEDYLMVLTADQERVWILRHQWAPDTDFTFSLSQRRRPQPASASYALRGLNRADQMDLLKNAHREFWDWSGDARVDNGSAERTIKIPLLCKVDEAERWLMRYPLSAFAQFALTGFEGNETIDWLISGRTLTGRRVNRRAIRRLLLNPFDLVRNAAVIINTYQHLANSPGCRPGVACLLSVLSIYREIHYGGGRLNMRWFLNPTSNMLRSILTDRSVTMIFADFEADTGEWQLGEGATADWHTDPFVNNDAIWQDNRPKGYFCLSNHQLDLKHVRLMRIAHCNSAFGPAADSKNAPAGEGTLVRQLLGLGARRVEGSASAHRFVDFIGKLLEMFWPTAQEAFLTMSLCDQHGIDFNERDGQIADWRRQYLSMDPLKEGNSCVNAAL